MLSRRTSPSAELERRRRRAERDRAGQHDDVLGGFLDLPHALEIADRRGDVFDADAQQRRHRDLEQLGELLQRLDLGDFAFFEAIERGARNAEPLAISSADRPEPRRKAFSRLPMSSKRSGIQLHPFVIARLDPAIHAECGSHAPCLTPSSAAHQHGPPDQARWRQGNSYFTSRQHRSLGAAAPLLAAQEQVISAIASPHRAPR